MMSNRGSRERGRPARATDRSRSGSANVRLERLGTGLQEQSLEPFLVTTMPGAEHGQQIMVHSGQEMVYRF